LLGKQSYTAAACATEHQQSFLRYARSLVEHCISTFRQIRVDAQKREHTTAIHTDLEKTIFGASTLSVEIRMRVIRGARIHRTP